MLAGRAADPHRLYPCGQRLAISPVAVHPLKIQYCKFQSWIIPTLKYKVDDTIKEPESVSRIGVVIKWHVLELSILRQEFIFECH